ncbi:hypothetical protein SAMN00017405_1566 [Desulfonispora thiosulfatigenes DSM 11270]|uniref:Uncharacterized protein n=1 Tax=Desulfonispora thiosulfatigenes DSM 11270 TaxID=656914 RepID=A0A1W1VT20_DESTI|nr:hypothetical protein [Desulfonispora thiosulfatigenes]SMB96499.1 hypothetical protein SAMN00017405_1566 [Desulfonispora thiosulfatigenes DSM 11270]
MLLLSYIFAGSLELALIVKSYQIGSAAFAWSFGFLFFISSVSIPVETSKIGKTIRLEFKNLGVNTAIFDFLSNAFRIITYLVTLSGLLSYILGLLIAYFITFIFMVIIISKYSKIEKKS